MGYTKNVREIVEQIKVADADELAYLEREYEGDPRQGLAKAFAAARRRIELAEAERSRVDKMYQPMREAGEGAVVVGVDEVGRGSLAGPLTVAAVVLPMAPLILGLNDSKRLTPSRREEIAADIERHAVAVGIAHIPPKTIDTIGMASSLRQAMAQSIEQTGLDPDLVLIDGNPVHVHPKERCIVKGDAKVACIAAASIIAKVTRDRLMVEADERYSGYGFADSKGYGTADHIAAIKELGLTDFHRKSFCMGYMQETLF